MKDITLVVCMLIVLFTSVSVFSWHYTGRPTRRCGGNRKCVCRDTKEKNITDCSPDMYIESIQDGRLSIRCQKDVTVASPLAGSEEFQYFTATDVEFVDCPVTDAIYKLVASAEASEVRRLNISSKRRVGCILSSYHLTELNSLNRVVVGCKHVEVSGNLLSGTNVQHFTMENSSATSLPQDIFHGAGSLTEINLRNNKLMMLHRNFFSDLTLLQRLDLSFNLLSSLPEELFTDLDSLVWLDLTGNRISFVSDATVTYMKSLRPLKNLNYLSLSGNTVTYLNREHLEYLSKLVELSLDSTNLSLLSNDSLEDLQHLEKLYMWNNSIEHLPIIPSTLIELNASDNKISSLPVKFLHNATRVMCLDISGNHFQTLPLELLTEAPDLHLFSVSKNKLQQLHHNMFLNNVQLVNLNLSYNLFSSFPQGLFRNLSRLESLDLDGNNLTIFPDHISEDLPRLQELFLSQNDFSQLPFLQFPELRRLHLSMNNISVIAEDFFRSIPDLQILDLSYNNIEYLPENAFDQLTSLKTLLLNNNLLSVFNNPSGLVHLYELDISNNLITSIDAYRTFEKLVILRASNNKLVKAVFKIAQLKELKYADLSRNFIQGFEAMNLLYLSTALTVNLKMNRISKLIVTEGQLYSPKCYENTIVVEVSDNPFQCNCHILPLLFYAYDNISVRANAPEIGMYFYGFHSARLDVTETKCANPSFMTDKRLDDIASWPLHLLTVLGLCQFASGSLTAGNINLDIECP